MEKQENAIVVDEKFSEIHFDQNIVSNKPWKVPCWNSLTLEVASAYRLIVDQELTNLRNTKLASEMVSYDVCYDRKLIFKLVDGDSKGFFTLKELKQFTYRLGQPTYDKTLRFFYQRIKLDFGAQVSAQDFMFFLFDIYEEGVSFLNKAYNFYYEKNSKPFKPKKKNPSTRQPSYCTFE